MNSSAISEPIFPGGTVTFLFTDIEGSTQLLESLRDQYEILISGHHEIVREALAEWNGREIDTQGDAFFAVFPKASEAVNAVVGIQRAIDNKEWPEDVQVLVRMGLHTGEPWLVEEGYMGIDVHRAARIGHVGYGGQVLLSETTTALVQGELPDGVSLLDLGRHRLKDMRRPEPIHQLIIAGLPSEFPPLKSLEALPALQPVPADLEAPGAPRKVGPSPYRGLAAFRESDAEIFFGRDAFIDQLSEAVGERHLVAVIIGPSGSGKSSTVFAGLLPQLREDGQWLIVETRPGSRPFHALAGALIPHIESESSETELLVETQRLAQVMRSGELGLFQVAKRILAHDGKAERVLLVIDQFEELFTHKPDPDAQRYFLDELISAAEAGSSYRRSPLVILLTLRADFMGQALGHRPFADALQDGSLILGPMNRDELQAAVERPAELAGAAFETGLVPRILDDVGQEPGNLPLLEFALTLLWERMEEGWMTHTAYDEIGRVDGALARYAEEVWSELDSDEQDAARPLFVQLVQPGEGTEDTRRVARRSELAEGLWLLVQHLADKRLVVTGRDEDGRETVEVVHEALIRSWDRLREWMMDDRAFRTWQEGLRVAQRGWEVSDRDKGALMRGAPLALALDWMAENESQIAPFEKEFVEVSQQENQRREAQREARRQRQLEAAQQIAQTEKARAEEQSKSAQNLRRRAYILGGVLVVAAILAVVAVFFAKQSNENAVVAEENALLAQEGQALANTREAEAQEQQGIAVAEAQSRATAQTKAEASESEAVAQRAIAQTEADFRATAEAIAVEERNIAEEQTRLTTSRELALAAFTNLKVDPERSVLLALEALEAAHTNEAESTLHQAVRASRIVHTFEPHRGMPLHVAYFPDGKRLATGGTDGTVRIWDLGTGEELVAFSGHSEDWMAIPEENWIMDVEISPDGDLLASYGENGMLRIWDAQTGAEQLVIEAPFGFEKLGYDGAGGLAFSPDGTAIASGFWNGAKIWDATTGEVLLEVVAHAAGESFDSKIGVSNVAFGPDGRLVTAGMDSEGLAIIWDAETGEKLLTLAGHDEYIFDVDFSPDGSHIATSSADKTVRIWDAATGEVVHSMAASGRLVRFSPDGSLLGDVGNAATIWDVATGEALMEVLGHQAWVTSIDFSQDGGQAVTSGADGTVRFWDIGPEHETLAFDSGHGWDVEVIYSPDGRHLATVGELDGTAHIWDARTGEKLLTLEGHTEWGSGIAYSSDGTFLVTSSDDGTAKLWDAATGENIHTFSGHESWVNTMALSQNDARLATAGADNKSIVWDMASREPLLTIDPGGDWGIALNADGTLVATVGRVDHSIGIWDVDSGQELMSLSGHEGAVWDIIFSPDGSRLLSVSDDTTARLWDLETGEGRVVADEPAGLWEAAISPDGKFLATGGRSGSDVTLWDIDTGSELVTFFAADSRITNLQFSADGSRLLSSDHIGMVREFVLPLEELVELAHSRVTRELTDDECRQYLHLEDCLLVE